MMSTRAVSTISSRGKSQQYQIVYGFNTEPRNVIQQMLSGIDISLVDPQIYPLLVPYLENLLEKARNDNDLYKIKEFEFYLSYINYQPRREELTRILKRPRPPPPVKVPVLTKEQVQAEVNWIIEAGTFSTYSQEEVDLLVVGLREKRAEYIQQGDYLAAERAENLSHKLFNNGQLTTVESLQQNKCVDLKQKLKDASEDLESSKKKWEELYSNLKESANNEFAELERQHNEQIRELEALFDEKPPPSIRKYSPTLLNLRRREEAMISSKLYAQASKIKEQADELQQQEDQQQIERWHRQIRTRINQTKTEQAKQLSSRKAFWKAEEQQMVREADSEIDQAQKAIDHLKNSLKNNLDARKMTTVMKKETRKKTKRVSTQKLPNLSTPRRDLHNTETRQRQILNHSIYTITNRNTPIKSPMKTPKRPNTSVM
ncbi:hypothetical protein TRFO_06052 [Tritrichomonas foetus]|uniref:Uncharacterized protein n=1 Tax=Tritrichomonas foetus TaxID=1144522 RepID=A0A1J4K5V5_9EUKA|nr:hypothetical protein TRFO_06052 [Tritrichomonas foetus]|eukprot:OHT05062.1 hypothetical protein TRFO_06052 [Tritrichomonas foetus]